MGVWIALYAILEETGWRGYLQGEFANRAPLVRYTITGAFWYAWHLSYLGGHTAIDEIVSLLFIIVASIGIGFVADRTRSIFAAASFHVIGNIMGVTVDFKTLVPSTNTRLLIILICVAVWLVMLRLWRMRDARIGALAEA
jgi:membrane protease YdiL (CAAX protease family)